MQQEQYVVENKYLSYSYSHKKLKYNSLSRSRNNLTYFNMAEEDLGFFHNWTFQFVVEGILMILVALFGLFGNSLSIYILNSKEVKMKKDFVEVLCSMSAYDNLFLLCAVVLFSLPQLSGMTRLS